MSGEDRDGAGTDGISAQPLAKTEAHSLPVYSRAEIERTVSAIPRFAREVFLMHRADGLTYEEIARQLGISERRVIRLMTKALTAIRRALDRIERRR